LSGYRAIGFIYNDIKYKCDDIVNVLSAGIGLSCPLDKEKGDLQFEFAPSPILRCDEERDEGWYQCHNQSKLLLLWIVPMDLLYFNKRYPTNNTPKIIHSLQHCQSIHACVLLSVSVVKTFDISQYLRMTTWRVIGIVLVILLSHIHFLQSFAAGSFWKKLPGNLGNRDTHNKKQKYSSNTAIHHNKGVCSMMMIIYIVAKEETTNILYLHK
jgi:hypothetical protein